MNFLLSITALILVLMSTNGTAAIDAGIARCVANVS